MSAEPLEPGAVFTLSGPGEYSASAVEWSGLESPAGLPLVLSEDSTLTVLGEIPADFAPTRRVWQIGGRTVPEAEAMRATRANMRLMHLHDGEIATQTLEDGVRTERVDLDREGNPIRDREFTDGKLNRLVYRTPEGELASEELFGPDGFKTEYIKYDVRPGRIGQVARHWIYHEGRPVKLKRGESVVFDEKDR